MANNVYVPPEDQTGDIYVTLAGVDFIVFPVGIEGMTLDFPNRAVITQAFDGVWADTLGAGIRTMTLSGTTGWRRNKDGLDGRRQLHRLINLHNTHMEYLRLGANDPKYWLFIGDSTIGGGVFQCIANNLKVVRDKARPTMFAFEWQLTVMSFKIAPAQLHPSDKKPDVVATTGRGQTVS